MSQAERRGLEDTTGSESEFDGVLVLLATFNGHAFIGEQLDSIAAQSYRNWRLVVADDGSTDGTREHLMEFAANHPGRVRILTCEAVGSARDNFLRLALTAERAAYYAFCDQDDVWMPNKLEMLVSKCISTEGTGVKQPCLVFSDLVVVDEELRTLNSSLLAQLRVRPHALSCKTILAENAIPGCAMLFNAALLRSFRSGDFRWSNIVMHDWWFALLAAALGRIAYVEEPLVLYRQHASNTLGAVERGGVRFVLAKLARGNRETTLQTYVQAGELVHAYGEAIPTSTRATLAGFASLESRSKLERIAWLIRNATLKQTVGRRAYQLLRA